MEFSELLRTGFNSYTKYLMLIDGGEYLSNSLPILQPINKNYNSSKITLQQIEIQWNKLHKHTMGGKIEIKSTFHDDDMYNPCSLLYNLLKSRNEIFPDACLIREVRKHFNFTPMLNNNLSEADVDLSLVKWLSRIYIGWGYDGQSAPFIRNYAVISRSVTFPIKYAIVLHESELSVDNLHGFYSSMDFRTWIFTAISLVSLCLVQHLLVRRWNLANIFLSLYGGLLSQGITVHNQCNKKGYLLILIWGFAVIVISNGSSSFLLALMTKPSIPTTPDNYESLIESRYP